MTIERKKKSWVVAPLICSLSFTTPALPADCNRNGIEDGADIATGQSPDCNQNLVPDECDVAPGVGYSGAKLFPIGTSQPRALAIEDFDGDGLPDLATANEGSDNVSILFNDGKGRFLDGFNIATAEQCIAIAAGDWDLDGRVDLVAGTREGVLPLWNRSKWRFERGSALPGSTAAASLASADLDGDGDLDVVAASGRLLDRTIEGVTVFLSDGAGHFPKARRTSMTASPTFVLAGDFDGDSIVDLATLSEEGIAILWGKGAGLFENLFFLPLPSHPFANAPKDLDAMDIDEDNVVDFVIAPSWADGQVTVLGQGPKREFRPPATLSPRVSRGGSLAAMDLNRDGHLDLAISAFRSIDVLLGAGAGAFAEATAFPLHFSADRPDALTPHDVNGDGLLDVVLIENVGQHAQVVLSNGDGTLSEPGVYSTAAYPSGIVAGDFDGDADQDLATANYSPNTTVLLNDGAVRFPRPISYGTGGNARTINAADFTGDGNLDLATAGYEESTLSILASDGKGAFSRRAPELACGSKPVALVTADLDRDGDIDLAVANEGSGDISVLVNVAGTGFEPERRFFAIEGAEALVATDSDDDGDLDLVVVSRSFDGVLLLPNLGSARFGEPERLAITTNGPLAVAAADLDGDGAEDLVTGNRFSEQGSILWKEAGGHYSEGQAPQPRWGRHDTGTIRIGDIDADGDLDLAFAGDNLKSGLALAWNLGKRNFSGREDVQTGGGRSSLALADLDADARLDFALTSYSDRVLVVTNHAVAPAFSDADQDGIPDVCRSQPFRRGDVNGDGRFDISDAVFILTYLFLGTAGPSCGDAADVNDDGRLNVSDPVHALNYLYRGGPAPSAPGPNAPGFDGTPTDAFGCGDELLQSCELARMSTLPGVTIDVSGNPCSIPLAEALKGVTFRYTVEIDSQYEHVEPDLSLSGWCAVPRPGELLVYEHIGGGGHYCVCDFGPCLPSTRVENLDVGVREATLEWPGRSWSGPSDFGNPLGDPFTPGTCFFEVVARGTYRDADGIDVFFEVKGGVQFELTP